MDALVEVHDENELQKAMQAGAKIIGINNRDLTTFQTTLATSLKLGEQIPAGVVKISESGVQTRKDIIELEKAGFDAVLVGEILMRNHNRTAFLKELRGESCG
jgi:indole-3-glycerol phosphate synthase